MSPNFLLKQHIKSPPLQCSTVQRGASQSSAVHTMRCQATHCSAAQSSVVQYSTVHNRQKGAMRHTSSELVKEDRVQAAEDGSQHLLLQQNGMPAGCSLLCWNECPVCVLQAKASVKLKPEDGKSRGKLNIYAYCSLYMYL